MDFCDYSYNNIYLYFSMKINLAITGCMGRMGQQIIKSAKSDKNLKISCSYRKSNS